MWALSLLWSSEAAALDLASSTSGWSKSVTSADLSSGAGSDLTSSYTSGPDATLLSISNAVDDNDLWRVDVKRDGAGWHANLTISTRRSGAGTDGGSGGTSVSGGTSAVSVTTTDSTFFSGSGNRNDIPIEYSIGGVSVNVPPATYVQTIIFTVVDN